MRQAALPHRSRIQACPSQKRAAKAGNGDGGKVLEISVASDPKAPRGAVWTNSRLGSAGAHGGALLKDGALQVRGQ